LTEDEYKKDHLEGETEESAGINSCNQPSCSKLQSEFVSGMCLWLRRQQVATDESELPECLFVGFEEDFDETDNDPNFESLSSESFDSDDQGSDIEKMKKNNNKGKRLTNKS
jgi:hypothetical protein